MKYTVVKNDGTPYTVEINPKEDKIEEISQYLKRQITQYLNDGALHSENAAPAEDNIKPDTREHLEHILDELDQNPISSYFSCFPFLFFYIPSDTHPTVDITINNDFKCFLPANLFDIITS